MNTGITNPVASLETQANNLQREKALSALKALGGSGQRGDKKLWEAAKGFESMFMAQMYKSMRKTLPENEFNKASTGRQIFTEMLDGEYAKMSSGKKENGLAGLIYRQLLLSQSNAQSETVNTPPEKLVKLQSEQKGAATLGKIKLSEIDLEPIIEKASKKYGVDSNLIKSVIQQESAGRPQAISSVGAKGLMQLMDGTAEDMGVKDVFDPEENIMGGTRYLNQLDRKFNGDEKLMLAAYNAGPGTVDRYKGVPPYPETEKYIEKVLNNKEKLNQKSSGGEYEHGNAP